MNNLFKSDFIKYNEPVIFFRIILAKNILMRLFFICIINSAFSLV